MAIPLYRAEKAFPASLEAKANVGLWFTRFYKQFEIDPFKGEWNVPKDATGKAKWIQTVTGPRGDKAALEAMAERMQALGKSMAAHIADLKTTSNFVTGLGLSHPVENGFTWHQTLGVPYLPASGVKGLLRAWVEEWMEHADDMQREQRIGRWFGASSDKQSESSAGHLIFFDALPMTAVTLVAEVMTPHMGQWYEKGGKLGSKKELADTAPADWHAPVPVPFLAVGKGTEFRFMIAPRMTGQAEIDKLSAQDCKEAMQELINALQWLGAGAKTATGYGRMENQQPKLSEDLLKAGIQIGGETWNDATVSLNKGKGILEVQSTAYGKAAPVDGERVKALMDTLDAAALKKLKDGKKPLKIYAEIERKGNFAEILSIKVRADV